MGIDYRPSYRDRLRVRVRRGLLNRLAEVVAPEGKRLLDLGGGTGAGTVVFGRGAEELVVLEPLERRIAQGHTARTPVSFVQGVAENLPWMDRSFDRVVSLVSLHHFADADVAIREAKRVLTPGGRLVVYDFDGESARGRWLSFWEGRVLRHGTHFAPTKEVAGMVTRAGFSSVTTERWGVGAFVVGHVV